MRNLKMKTLKLLTTLLACFAAAALCLACSSTGTIEGRLGSDEAFGQQSAAITQGATGMFGQLRQPLSIDGIIVDLLRVEPGGDPDSWSVVNSVQPEPDGSFSFSGVAAGDYALRLNQPEFGGPAYGVDATDFHLDEGQTVSLILPLITNINISAPGVGMSFGWAEPPLIDLDTGLIYGAHKSLDGYGAFWVFDPDRGLVDLLHSKSLFSQALNFDNHVVALAEGRNKALVVTSDRIVKIDLSIFEDAEVGEALDYDDPAVRVRLGEKTSWRLIPPTSRIAVAQSEASLRAYLSADESVLYVSWEGQGGSTQIIDVETLEVRRVVQGWAVGYHPTTDQLVFSGGQGVFLVDASQMRDVGVANIQANLGVAPVPGRPEFIVAYDILSANDERVPFIAVIDDSANVLSDQQASEYLGTDTVLQSGAPSFDSTGEYFMLGAQAFRILDGGGFEEIGVQVPPGPSFLQRVACNQQRVFDPVHRYEVWYDCGPNNGMSFQGAMALISADQTSIPVSVRVNSTSMVLDAPRGRALFFFGGGAGNLLISVVHYADPAAATKPEQTKISAGEALLQPGAVCDTSRPCEGNQVCRGDTDTSWTGTCVDNPRRPYLAYCGGITGVACDDGFDCELSNPTNPESFGICTGQPNRDYENHGPACGTAGTCPAGFSCNELDRCVPRGCLGDADCETGEVCGMVADIGRVCVTPGLLEDYEICSSPENCLHGACVDTGLSGEPRVFMLCATSCMKNADCPIGSLCVLPDRNFHEYSSEPFPFCAHDEWLHGSPSTSPCTTECEADQICIGDQCQIGFSPRFQGASGQPDECTVDTDCAVPGNCLQQEFGRSCGFACLRNRDCPWPVDCMAGVCPVADTESPTSQYPCNEGLGCVDHEMCVQSLFSWDAEFWYLCLDADPCRSDADCAAGYHCDGVCTEPCDPNDGHSAADCDPGLQCVLSTLDAWSEHKCLPPVCDCPDSGAHNAYCVLDTNACFIDLQCAAVACDGTFGPDNPDPEVDETCCAPGNPCGLSGEEICACPASCPWWTPGDCNCPSENCPVAGGLPLCPEGYNCALRSEPLWLFGDRCNANP